MLGVERLDYTKGIPQKLRAFERFLEQDPERARHDDDAPGARAVAARERRVPGAARRDRAAGSRTSTAASASPAATPVEYLHRSVSPPELVALYRRADVMMVTPLRDGMNLVAQEFVLCQTADRTCRAAGAARCS